MFILPAVIGLESEGYTSLAFGNHWKCTTLYCTLISTKLHECFVGIFGLKSVPDVLSNQINIALSNTLNV